VASVIYLLLLLAYVGAVVLALLSLLFIWIAAATAFDVYAAREKRANDRAVLESIRKNRP
jgi:hypothetical protein